MNTHCHIASVETVMTQTVDRLTGLELQCVIFMSTFIVSMHGLSSIANRQHNNKSFCITL